MPWSLRIGDEVRGHAEVGERRRQEKKSLSVGVSHQAVPAGGGRGSMCLTEVRGASVRDGRRQPEVRLGGLVKRILVSPTRKPRISGGRPHPQARGTAARDPAPRRRGPAARRRRGRHQAVPAPPATSPASHGTKIAALSRSRPSAHRCRAADHGRHLPARLGVTTSYADGGGSQGESDSTTTSTVASRTGGRESCQRRTPSRTEPGRSQHGRAHEQDRGPSPPHAGRGDAGQRRCGVVEQVRRTTRQQELRDPDHERRDAVARERRRGEHQHHGRDR